MAVNEGACRFGLWWVHVTWSKNRVYRVRFSRTGTAAPVPPEFVRFCAGKGDDLHMLSSVATEEGGPYASLYREVRKIPYGHTVTYGEIGTCTGFSPRVVGIAMRRNPTPLIVPCHRVVARDGPGGFTPDPRIKQALLDMEKRKI